MKISKITVFIIVFSVILFNSIVISEENSNIIYVDEDGTADYISIQDAIDAADDGSTIYVYGGIYNEIVNINKTINLIGENKDTTIINGSGDGVVLYISSIYVNISGFTIKNSGDFSSGIKIYFDYNSVTNNIIINNGFGIMVDDLSIDNGNNVFAGNIIKDNKYEGIYLINSSNNLIINNTISNNKQGLVFADNSEYNLICYNNFIHNSENHVFSQYNYINNTFYNEELKHGNYWDNYNGTDKNNDGIGDTPYNFSSNVQDNFPLMNPYQGRIIIDKFYVDEFSVQLMLLVGMIATIIFCIPIGLWWRKKYFK